MRVHFEKLTDATLRSADVLDAMRELRQLCGQDCARPCTTPGFPAHVVQVVEVLILPAELHRLKERVLDVKRRLPASVC